MQASRFSLLDTQWQGGRSDHINLVDGILQYERELVAD